MYGLQNTKSNVLLAIYQDRRSVFRLRNIAMLTGETNFQSLNKKLNYAVRTGKLLNPRKGIYAKPGYDPEELACSIFSPAYISLEYVLQKAGIIFQYDPRITVVSYLSRNINVENRVYAFRKIKNTVLIDMSGINRKENHVNIATPERAFLDTLYLGKNYYFDNLNPLKMDLVYKLIPLYQTKALTLRINQLLKNG